MSLKTIDLCKSFSGSNVLKSITLSFEPSTVTAIVGDNGAGKSTLLKIIAGVTQPTSGKVLLEEENLNNLSIHEHRQAGIEMVYQDLALAKMHDPVSNIFMGREYRKLGIFLDKKRMYDVATEELSKLLIHVPNLQASTATLSGGQQQAIAIARAVLFDPKVLLLDEPTAALASRETEHLLEIITAQKSAGRTVVLVSHRLNDVFAVSDRIIVLKQGHILSDNKVSDVTMPEIVRQIMS